MGSTLVTGGTYTVELDTGEIEDGFQLGDPVRGILAGYTTQTTRTNLLINPNFETDTTGWQALGTGTTITRITTDSYSGSACLQVSTGTVANSAAITLSSAGNRTPVTAGLPYYLSAYVKVPTGLSSCSLRLRTLEFRADGTQNAAQVSTTTVVADTDGWVRLSFADTPTAGATPTVTMSFRVEITTSVARTYLVDSVLFEQSSTLLPYFDGGYAASYPTYTLISQSWSGTANASTSSATWGLTSTYVQGYPLTGTTTFTDVSDLVSAVQIRRGRRKIKDQFVAGSISLSLFDNANRDLDPYNTSSVFFNASAELPGLSPNRQIRVSRNGTYLFRGRVTGYRYEYGELNVAIITGADDFVLLASLELDAQTPTLQSSADRVSAILDLASVAWGTNRDITTSPDTTLGAYPIAAGTNVLAYLQKIALKAEAGRLYMRAADNYLVFEQRIGNTLSGPVVSFADVGVGLPYNTLSIDYTADDVINRASITRTGGTEQTAQDATSIATYYAQEYSDTDNLVSTDAQALTLAQYLLFPTPEPRFTALEVSFASIPDSGDQDSIAFLEIGETIEITRTFTAGTPASITEELAIEGIEHRIEAGRGHFVTLYTSPTDVVYAFTLGDAVYGVLGVADPQPVLV